MKSVRVKMWWKTGIVLITIVSSWASAEFVKPDYIENVIKGAGESRIVSGWEATPGQHPHHAALRMVNLRGSVSACGGSIVHRKWMITAAHCTAGSITLVVRAGVTDLTRPEYIFETTEWFNHPTYNDLAPSLVQPNDISIVRLQRPVVYSDNLRGIRLQPASEAYKNYEGQILYASGHGRTWTGGGSPEVLNWVYLRGVSNPSCATVFGSIITSATICAQFYNVTSQSICQGDSGGPLVTWNEDGDPVLVGVSSFVAGGQWGCHSGLPGGFIRPGPFHSWFYEVTGINFDGLEEEEENVTTSTTTESTTTNTTSTTTTSAPPTTTNSTSAPPNTTTSTTAAPTTTNSTSAPPNTTTSTTAAPITTTSTTAAPNMTTSTSAPPNTTTSTTAAPNTTTSTTATPNTTTSTTAAPTTTSSTSAPTTEQPGSEESDKEDESDSSSSEEDPELSELMKRLEVKVKVKVKLSKNGKKHEHEHEHEHKHDF